MTASFKDGSRGPTRDRRIAHPRHLRGGGAAQPRRHPPRRATRVLLLLQAEAKAWGAFLRVRPYAPRRLPACSPPVGDHDSGPRRPIPATTVMAVARKRRCPPSQHAPPRIGAKAEAKRTRARRTPTLLAISTEFLIASNRTRSGWRSDTAPGLIRYARARREPTETYSQPPPKYVV